MLPFAAFAGATAASVAGAEADELAAAGVDPAAPAIWIATTPPNGPAPDGLTILTRQTLDWPATVPVQVVPAGMVAANG